ncbi:MAG: ribonuclease III [Verrucomicrobiota bacterium]|nr:ribonuclease III [Verrucomicrobiota bacterium]
MSQHEYPLDPLQARLSHQFEDLTLLEQALEHPSLRIDGEHPSAYERLEFLGDAVLELIISDHLFKRFPNVSEGMLTRMRAALSNRTFLHSIAEIIDLGRYIKVGKGERIDSGPSRKTILADACEAVIGAIYLDGGMEAARKFILEEWEPFVATSASEGRWMNPKGQLQELAQATLKVHPVYKIINAVGRAHDMHFEVEVELGGRLLGKGHGTSKRKAQKNAAIDALNRWESIFGPPIEETADTPQSP